MFWSSFRKYSQHYTKSISYNLLVDLGGQQKNISWLLYLAALSSVIKYKSKLTQKKGNMPLLSSIAKFWTI